jgi:hypothetical protein
MSKSCPPKRLDDLVYWKAEQIAAERQRTSMRDFKFDFGIGESPAESYIQILPDTLYESDAPLVVREAREKLAGYTISLYWRGERHV